MREKQFVALSSVLGAAMLTALKVLVGITTGSLGILSEAAHSSLDLVAAVITYSSVRISDKPPDESHPFGHGKFENLSAFVQTALLLLTSAWIVLEAVRRLAFHTGQVEPSGWAFAVLFASMTIDTARSRALFRAARKFDSQALEADAVHFSMDVYSTGVVIIGLGCIYAAQQSHLAWLLNADPIAALIVAGSSLVIGLRLGNRTLGALVDAAPAGVSEAVTRAVHRIPGVLRQERVRVRRAGPQLFIELRLVLESNIALERATAVTQAVERTVHDLYPDADVVVDVVPQTPPPEDLVERIRAIAHTDNHQVHDVSAFAFDGRVDVNLDLEVDPTLSLLAAHEEATRLERAIQDGIPEVHDVNVHIEPRQKRVPVSTDAPSAQTAIEETLTDIVRATPGVDDCHAVEVRYTDGHMVVGVHCTMRAGLPVAHVHALTERLELALRERFPQIAEINIHPEPR